RIVPLGAARRETGDVGSALSIAHGQIVLQAGWIDQSDAGGNAAEIGVELAYRQVARRKCVQDAATRAGGQAPDAEVQDQERPVATEVVNRHLKRDRTAVSKGGVIHRRDRLWRAGGGGPRRRRGGGA